MSREAAICTAAFAAHLLSFGDCFAAVDRVPKKVRAFTCNRTCVRLHALMPCENSAPIRSLTRIEESINKDTARILQKSRCVKCNV